MSCSSFSTRYRALFGMPKKDRVVLGDRIIGRHGRPYYNLAYKFMESRDYYKLLFVRDEIEGTAAPSKMKVIAESSRRTFCLHPEDRRFLQEMGQSH